MDAEITKVIIPAAIGAIGAILTLVIKDILLVEIRERREKRQQLLDRQLSQLYGPIHIAMHAGEGMISNIFQDDDTFNKFVTNLHLLSPDLRSIAEEYIRLSEGGDVRRPNIKHSDMKKAIELSKQFCEILGKEITNLRDQYQGGGKMGISNERLQRGANWATIIAGITAILTLSWGFLIFRQTSKEQADAASVRIMQDYLQFTFTRQDIANRPSTAPIDDQYLWFAAHNMLVAETIYKLNIGEQAWEATAAHIIDDHRPFINHKSFPCAEYDPRFISFIRKHIGQNICASQ